MARQWNRRGESFKVRSEDESLQSFVDAVNMPRQPFSQEHCGHFANGRIADIRRIYLFKLSPEFFMCAKMGYAFRKSESLHVRLFKCEMFLCITMQLGQHLTQLRVTRESIQQLKKTLMLGLLPNQLTTARSARRAINYRSAAPYTHDNNPTR